ncbi:MAG: zinc-dependent peptidase [Kiritimatiellaeota bacterium]|nr:zinc-dependent peptidase [Kiritimatiellota bacterium]
MTLRVASKRRREAVMNAPFPLEWERIIKKNIAVYEKLSESERFELKRLTLLFLDGKEFEGCGGLEITDEIRVTIAAEATLLLLNRNITESYPKLHTVLVYPHAYVASSRDVIGAQGTIEDVPSVRLGEAWQDGEIVLAWDHAKNGSRDFDDGQNVVLHEFSHKLDQASGTANGAPILKDRSSYKTWGMALNHDFRELREKVERHKKDVIDSYGATNPAEFFAVATETFFEKPGRLKEKHPELFEELRKYYNLDPEDWKR